jgi:hypothetical protein
MCLGSKVFSCFFQLHFEARACGLGFKALGFDGVRILLLIINHPHQ